MLKTLFILVLAIWAAAVTANAQGFYRTGSDTFMTGYGQVHGSFGYALATQRMYESMQMNMQRSMWRAAMVKRHGEAAVRRAEEAARRGSSSGSSQSAGTINVPPPPPAPKYHGRYRPDRSVNMAVTISNTLFEEPADRAQLKEVIEVINAAYKKEATAKGWNNNFAGGVTFFIVSMATIYHDTPEPDDATLKAIFDAVNQAIDEVPEFATASNKDKQTINDMLVGFSALPLAIYTEAKSNGDSDSLQTARALAGEMIKLVLKTDPDNVKFENGVLQITR